MIGASIHSFIHPTTTPEKNRRFIRFILFVF